MIFIFGVGFVMAGIIGLIFFLRKVNRPKSEAVIEEITLDYGEKDKNQIKKHPHGHIKYMYRSVNYTAKILLLKRKMQVGDEVIVSFKEDHPEKPTMYAPKQELITVVVLFAIGAVFMGISVFAMDYFDLW